MAGSGTSSKRFSGISKSGSESSCVSTFLWSEISEIKPPSSGVTLFLGEVPFLKSKRPAFLLRQES